MKKLRYILSVALMLCIGFGVNVQGQDSRNRVASTIVADALAQLPADNVQVYDQVMGEIAQTGSEGVKMLIGMLNPTAKGGNAPFEYAINGVVDYVTRPDKADLREAVKRGIVDGLAMSKDKPQTAFLLWQLQKCGTAADIAVFERYLTDADLSGAALRGLAALPGIDAQLVDLVRQSSLPKHSLAHLITLRRFHNPALEPVLLSWTAGADAQTLRAIYQALAVCGTSQSLKTLAAAAQKVGFGDDALHATDAYIQLLSGLVLTDAKTVNKLSRQLIKQNNRAVRCAGLELMLKTSDQKAADEVQKALQDADIQYRNTALRMAKDCAGDGIFAAVMQRFGKLSVPAQIDVVRWLGNEHVASAADLMVLSMNSNQPELAEAAIFAGAQIGGDKALAALVGLLGGAHADKAYRALLAFHGSIDGEVIKALDHNNVAVRQQALKLVAHRHMYRAYDRVSALLASSDKAVEAAAYEALCGISQPEHFNALCDMMEKADAAIAVQLQRAALYALHQLSAEEQFGAIRPRLASTSHAQLYYPLLAQAGNKPAIDKLVEGYENPTTKAEAFDALLRVDSDLTIELLFRIASADPSRKDQALKRSLDLVGVSKYNAIRKYQLYRRALDLQPSVQLENSFIDALGGLYEWPALALAARYLDKPDNAFSAATAVKAIVNKNSELQGGVLVKTWLEKAEQVFAAKKNDPDAGYAVDEIKGLLSKLSTDGYAKLFDRAQAAGKTSVQSNVPYENFELYADWKTKGEGMLHLRSMPEVELNGKAGAAFIYSEKQGEIEQNVVPDMWNTLHVKLVNDRIMIESNGVIVIENAIVKNVSGRPILPQGLISFLGANDTLDVRDVCVHTLPATPVYTLSAEEKAAGFDLLFDGRSLDKWQGNLVDYVPVDGNIYVSAKYGNGGNLYSKKKYGDFVYRFEFCFDKPGVNNGIGIRTSIGVDAAYEGMEIQVLDHDDPIYKGLHDYQQHGSVYGIIVPKHVQFGPLGTWNVEEIRAVGDRITVTVNGQVILDGNIREACQGHPVAPDGGQHNPYTIDHKNHPGLFNKDGYISFCGHGEGVKFRHIRILDLSKSKKRK